MKAVLALLGLGLGARHQAAGHGSLVWPLPRGGVDRDVAPFLTGGWPKGHYPCTCTNGTGECRPGQSCLWFNQGCTIGCPCSGNGTMSRVPNWSSCSTPGTSTNNDPRTRSINRGAAAGSKEDLYRYMPWRAPGTAVPADACGVAGGDQHGKKQTAGGEYYPTKHAKLGDLGSKTLKPFFSGANWKAGSVVNATWFIQANHAGTETIVRMKNGKESVVNATFLSEGTTPKGSTWKMNPVPECCPGASDTEAGACEKEGYTCGSYQHTGVGPKCGNHGCGVNSGLGKSVPAFPWPTDDPTAPPTGVAPKFDIIDQLRLPAGLTPGHYVLGWRWDCEETAQSSTFSGGKIPEPMPQTVTVTFAGTFASSDRKRLTPSLASLAFG